MTRHARRSHCLRVQICQIGQLYPARAADQNRTSYGENVERCFVCVESSRHCLATCPASHKKTPCARPTSRRWQERLRVFPPQLSAVCLSPTRCVRRTVRNTVIVPVAQWSPDPVRCSWLLSHHAHQEMSAGKTPPMPNLQKTSSASLSPSHVSRSNPPPPQRNNHATHERTSRLLLLP